MKSKGLIDLTKKKMLKNIEQFYPMDVDISHHTEKR